MVISVQLLVGTVNISIPPRCSGETAMVEVFFKFAADAEPEIVS